MSPYERADAGNALGELGDPRFNSNYWHLPDEKYLGFVEVPGGEFLRSDDSRHQIDRFYVARYPVTNSQFKAFIEQSRYVCQSGFEPPKTRRNRPIVLVTYADASAYCDWLTNQLHNRRDLPAPMKDLLASESWRVAIPTYDQWVKAARGGLKLPNDSGIYSDNPNPNRIYPWGDDQASDLMNSAELGVNETTPVGVFSNGVSPYGIFDMSGNVLEWIFTDRNSSLSVVFEKTSVSWDYDVPRKETTKADVLLLGGAYVADYRLATIGMAVRGFQDNSSPFVGFRVALIRGSDTTSANA